LVSIFQIDIYLKTLLTTKRRISFRGSFVNSKEKHLKQGKKIQKLENASCNLTHMLLTICKKDFEKTFQKKLQKQKRGACVVQNVK
jgi:hypothetical protein